MLYVFLLYFLLFPTISPLISPVRGPNGEPDLDSIINHLNLLEQTVEGLKGVETETVVLQSSLQKAESEIASLTSDLSTCKTDVAVIKSQMQSLQSCKDKCDRLQKEVANLTNTEAQLQQTVSSLSSAIADVYNKSISNSKFLSSMHGVHDLIRIDDWVLVFRVEADIGISAYETWTNDNIYHDNPMLPWLVGPECQTLHTAHQCRVHFKSKLVTLWDEISIQQVKLLLIKNSQIRQEVLFDGVGTTKNSWFSRDHVINSTWTDLKTAPVNFFSIKGDDSKVHRRFFMNSRYHGCPDDQFWLTVVDAAVVGAPGECMWDQTSVIPKIIYSRGSTRSTTGQDLHDLEYGDVMAILVKLGDM